MIPSTPGSKEDAAEEHAKRLAAFYQLQKMYLEFKAQLELTDRLDYIVDQVFGWILFLAGAAMTILSFWYFGAKALNESVSVAVAVRCFSFAISVATIGVVLFAVGIWLTRSPFPTHPYYVIVYGLIFSFVAAVFGVVGVIPIALLFP